MKCYLKYNFQYWIVSIVLISLALNHFIDTNRLGVLVGSLIVCGLSIIWSLYRYHEVFGRK